MIITTLLALGAAAVGLSGAARISSAQDRLKNAAEKYKQIIEEAEGVRQEVEKHLEAIGLRVNEAMEHLKIANSILKPLDKRSRKTEYKRKVRVDSNVLTTLNNSSLMISDHSHLASAGLGLGVGSAVAAGSWAAVSMLGTASTGAAISGLHGAALTNATLAWFGNGSRAAGGAGIAGGKVALFGMVFLPVAFALGIGSHIKAGEIDSKAAELEAVNSNNGQSLARMKTQEGSISGLEPVLRRETEFLARAVSEAHKNLFRFGWLSKIRKTLRYRFRGYYYKGASPILPGGEMISFPIPETNCNQAGIPIRKTCYSEIAFPGWSNSTPMPEDT